MIVKPNRRPGPSALSLSVLPDNLRQLLEGRKEALAEGVSRRHRVPKPKERPASKGRVHKGKTRS